MVNVEGDSHTNTIANKSKFMYYLKIGHQSKDTGRRKGRVGEKEEPKERER